MRPECELLVDLQDINNSKAVTGVVGVVRAAMRYYEPFGPDNLLRAADFNLGTWTDLKKGEVLATLIEARPDTYEQGVLFITALDSKGSFEEGGADIDIVWIMPPKQTTTREEPCF